MVTLRTNFGTGSSKKFGCTADRHACGAMTWHPGTSHSALLLTEQKGIKDSVGNKLINN